MKRLEFFFIKVNVFMENLRAGMSNPANYKKFKRKLDDSKIVHLDYEQWSADTKEKINFYIL